MTTETDARWEGGRCSYRYPDGRWCALERQHVTNHCAELAGKTLELPELAPRVALELAAISPAGADAWSARPSNERDDRLRWCYLDRADGLSICLSITEGRLHVRGEWPTRKSTQNGNGGWSSQEVYRPYRFDGVDSITVALTTPAKRIAAEIRRRLLPTFEPEWKTQGERLASAEQYDATTKATAAELARRYGLELGRHDRGSQITLWSRNDDRRIEAKVSGERIKLELDSLSLETVARILSALSS